MSRPIKVLAMAGALSVVGLVAGWAQAATNAPATGNRSPAPAAAPAPSAGQAQGASAAANTGDRTDSRVLSFDLGMNAGMSLAGGGTTAGRSFGLGFTVSDNLSVGVADITAAGNEYLATRFSYGFGPQLGLNLYVGSKGGAAPAVGAGISYALLKSSSPNGLVTLLKLRLEYFFDTAGQFQNGDFMLAVATSLGI